MSGRIQGARSSGRGRIEAERRAMQRELVTLREALAREVTARAELDERLGRSQALLQQTSALARIGGWELDVASGLVALTPEAVALLDRREHDTVAFAAFLEHFPCAAATAVEGAIQSCIQTGRPFDLELPMTTTAGWSAAVRIMGQREVKPGGRVRVWGCMRDLTERKREESDLIAAREVALEASRIKSHFLANMSHEIRTPLNGVIGMAALALETNLSDESRDYVVTIKNSANALLQLVNDILDITKVESGKLDLEAIPFELGGLVGEAAAALATTAGAKGVDLVVDFALPYPQPRIGDPARLRQILLNLLSNAVKFTERGQVRLRVERVEGEPNGLRFLVVDSGIGIQPDRLESIFEAFTQADGTLTRRFGGTGLGLTICRQLAQMMGGDIAVASMPQVGSTFTCTVRLPPAPEDQLDAAVSRPNIPPDARVLIVERNADARVALVQGLARLGVRAIGARHAAEALQRTQEAAREGFGFIAAAIDAGLPMHGARAVAEALELRRPGIALCLSVVPETGGATRTPPSALLKKSLRKPLLPWELALSWFPASPRTQSTPLFSGPTLVPSGLRVLLAEDNPVNAKIAVRMLERLGHTVKHVTDGTAAVEATVEGAFDVILMDVQMPELDGLEATRRIRSREIAWRAAPLPIIALTAHAMKGAEEECLAAGMSGYLTKPLDPRRLDGILRRLGEGGVLVAPEPAGPFAVAF